MVLFCTACGSEAKANDRFCVKCGKEISASSNFEADTADTRTRPLTLDAFTKRREQERQSHFKPSKKPTTSKPSVGLTSSKHPTPSLSRAVHVNVGILGADNYGELKPLRGKRLPVKVKDSCNRLDLKAAAIRKHSDHDQSFIANDEYVLLYPDFTEVITVPGDNTLPFKLGSYKDELGKPFSQISFYLCPLAAFMPKNKEAATVVEDSDDFKGENVSLHDSFQAEIFDFPLPHAFPALFPSVPSSAACPLPSSHNQCLDAGILSKSASPKQGEEPTKQASSNLSYHEDIQNLSQIFSRESTDGETVVLAIRRRRVWQDTCQKLPRLFRDGVKPIIVQFIGEAGVDAGGPLKEFFTILFEDVKKCLFCTGNSSTFTFLHDTERLRSGEFRLFGTLVAIALIHGCAGPHYFMPALISRILKSPYVQPTTEDIPDFEVQSRLNELKVATTEKEFEEKMSCFPERFAAGMTNPFISIKDKDQFIKNIAEHFCLSACALEIEDFIQGLDLLGLLSILQDHCEESKLEFCIPNSLKASDFLLVFTTVDYTLGEDNRETREKEEDVYFNLTSFIEGLQYDAPRKSQAIELEDENEIHVERYVSLPDVLKFSSGSKHVTKDMIGKGCIHFLHPKPEQFGMGVMANTCSLVLTIPVSPRYSGSPATFHDSFVSDICSAPDFGMV